MFDKKISIINLYKEKYYRHLVEEVFYCTNKIVSQDGRGEKYTTVHTVIFSAKSLEKFVESKEYNGNKESFTLKQNDIIVLGECNDIETLKELENGDYEYFLIKSISDNRYGSDRLKNIEVTD